MLENLNSDHTAHNEDELEHYGVDPTEAVGVADEDYQVHFNPPALDLTLEQQRRLPDPFQNDSNHGKTSYVECVDLLASYFRV